MSRLLERVKATHGWRSWQRYGAARGGVLAGGVTFLGFFSIVPALILGFTIFGIVLRSQPALFHQVVDSISQTLPGIVRDRAHPTGLIDASHPPTPNALTLTGAISLVALLLGGLGWLDALREGVRAIFDQPPLQINPIKGKVRDLVILATLGLAVFASGLISTAVGAAGPFLLHLAGVAQGSALGTVVLSGIAVLVVFAVDLAIMLVILRLLSGLALPPADVRQGCIVGALGLGIIKLAGGLLLKGSTSKPVFASFAVIVGLLLMINLISRVILLAAAWAATTAHDQGHLAPAVPVVPAVPGPVAARAATLPSFGQRSSDGVAVAAGAVLGLSAAVLVRTARRGLHAAVGAVRGR